MKSPDIPPPKKRAPRNRTLTLQEGEQEDLKDQILHLNPQDQTPLLWNQVCDRIILGDMGKTLDRLPENTYQMVFLDPPYNLTKRFNAASFDRMSDSQYAEWLQSWVPKISRLLMDGGSLYFCCDWKTSPLAYNALSPLFQVQNRITWEREKGRGSQTNWKNCLEDIWYFTKGKPSYFDPEAVKLRRRVMAPYRNAAGDPKDWKKEGDGKYRDTAPSNFWSDITIPFWSMPENTDHPTQKPEKLLAKLILASTPPGSSILDPFSGSGTTAVVARKLGRCFTGIEIDPYYGALSLKRLQRADSDHSIQGYEGGVFWERNSAPK